MTSGWAQTKIVLDGFFNLLACGKCKKTPEKPIRYITCGHFFCDVCIYGETTCYQCKIPVRPNDIQPYRTVAKLIEYCQIIKDVISEIQPEDLKPLAKAVHQFAAVGTGVVPETDSESEDEVIQSTPPDSRSGEKKNIEKYSTLSSDAHEKKDSKPRTADYIDPTQLPPHQRKQIFEPETAGYVDPTPLPQRHGKKDFQPETIGSVDPTPLPKRHGNKDLNSSTVGYVDPTQLPRRRGKKDFEPETVGYVDPTPLPQRHRKQDLNSSTIGYVDPTQLLQRNGEQDFNSSTVGYVDPTQLPERHEKPDLNSSTVGYVDPTQLPERRGKPDLDSPTVGYVDPTQLPERRGKPDLDSLNVGYVDPTEIEKILSKHDSEGKTTKYIDPMEISKSHEEENLQPETLGYLERTQTPPSHKKKIAPLKPCRFFARTSKTRREIKNSKPEAFLRFVEPTRVKEVHGTINLQPETAGYVDSTETSPCFINTNLVTESSEFIDPTPNNQRGRAILQPKTAGYLDPTQSNKRPEKNKQTLKKNNDLDPEYSTKNWYEEMYSVEATDDIQQCLTMSELNRNLVLAPKSIETDRSTSERNVVPEILETREKTPDYGDSAMEIDNSMTDKSFSKKITPTKIRQVNIENTNVPDDTMENMDIQDETPLKQFRRIKSLALNRRSKIRTNIRDPDSSIESVEIKRKSPEKKLKIVENFTLEGRKKISLINRDTVSIDKVKNFGEETEEYIEKTPPKQRRRKSNLANSDKKISSIDHDSPSVVNTMISTEKTLVTDENLERTEGIKDLACRKKISTIYHDTPSVASATDEDTKSSKIEDKEPVQHFRSVENLEIKSRDKGSAKKCKEKLVKLTSRRSIDKSRTPVTKVISKNLNKRNVKGETPLHTACVKGQEDYVKALLDAGSNPNTKDNANWTPLQEAVSLGHREICEMLLQAGASANTPAMDNRTALHDAAANDKFEEVALLLRFNASRNVYDKFGKRPIDYAVSDGMRALLASDNHAEENLTDITCHDSNLDQSIIVPNAKVICLPSNLSSKNRKLLTQLASKLGVEVATSFRPTVTHVIVETNERNITQLTYYVMLAILQGKWILNSQWITIGTDLNDISEIDLELFEIRGAPYPGTPTRARVNEEKQNPRLFNNCYFYFAIGARCTWSYEKFEFTKESLATLVLGGQGEILNREPDPEDVKHNRLTPFHVADKPIHPLHRCSHYIIYMPGKDEPRVKYNMPHIKTLPVGWFLECIEKFALVDPSLMGIS